MPQDPHDQNQENRETEPLGINSESVVDEPFLADSSFDDVLITQVSDDEIPESRVTKRRGNLSAVPRDAKSTPPTIDEWSKFFSGVVLRVATDWYLGFAFRGIDEDELSEREIERVALTEDERKLISVPFAELANKTKFMRRHGRVIVSSGDAINSLVVMGAWMSRVSRIASKHSKTRKVADLNGHSGQSTPQASSTNGTTGTTGGRFPEWYSGPVYPGSS
jgi:hypothetical protein